MNYSDHFKLELANQSTHYFIFDSRGESFEGDIDFVQYSWATNFFSKVKAGDLVIFRRPGKASETKKFYFYGAAKVGVIVGTINVTTNFLMPYPFVEHLHMHELEDFKWSFRPKGESWLHFFNRYGMNQINKTDFENLLTLADNGEVEIDPDAATQAYQDMQLGKYFVDDKEGKVKVRNKQGVFANKVKDQYKSLCAVCGIKTRAFLCGSHIIPWSVDKNIRLDPANGISLCTFHDKAFDLGYFTVNDDLTICSTAEKLDDKLLKKQLRLIHGAKLSPPQKNSPNPLYLKHHRDLIFEKFLK